MVNSNISVWKQSPLFLRLYVYRTTMVSDYVPEEPNFTIGEKSNTDVSVILLPALCCYRASVASHSLGFSSFLSLS
jgi:hypothetical protein